MPILIAIVVIIALIIGVIFWSNDSDLSDTKVDETAEEMNRPVGTVTEDNSQPVDEIVPDPGSDPDPNTDEETDVNKATPTPSTDADKGPIESSAVDNDPVSDKVSGTFTQSATYQTPARTTQEIDVTLTLKEGIVTDANIVYDHGPSYSNPNQERFDKAYKAEVIGKNLENISLSRVGGASLTTGAFNEAVAKISTEAS